MFSLSFGGLRVRGVGAAASAAGGAAQSGCPTGEAALLALSGAGEAAVADSDTAVASAESVAGVLPALLRWRGVVTIGSSGAGCLGSAAGHIGGAGPRSPARRTARCYSGRRRRGKRRGKTEMRECRKQHRTRYPRLNQPLAHKPSLDRP